MSQANANVRGPQRRDIPVSGIIWIIIVGFVAGIIARFLSPIERVLGATLLGSETVNSIKNGGMGSGVR